MFSILVVFSAVLNKMMANLYRSMTHSVLVARFFFCPGPNRSFFLQMMRVEIHTNTTLTGLLSKNCPSIPLITAAASSVVDIVTKAKHLDISEVVNK